jgi:hypothetical protein
MSRLSAREPKNEAPTALATYRAKRYWWLRELGRVAAQSEIGSVSLANAAKERRSIQRELLALRPGCKLPKARKGRK